jgi:hypothetical protein
MITSAQTRAARALFGLDQRNLTESASAFFCGHKSTDSNGGCGGRFKSSHIPPMAEGDTRMMTQAPAPLSADLFHAETDNRAPGELQHRRAEGGSCGGTDRSHSRVATLHGDCHRFGRDT